MPSETEESLFEILAVLKRYAPKGEWFCPRNVTPKLKLLGGGIGKPPTYRFLKERGYADSRYSSVAVEYRLTDKAYSEDIPDRDTKFAIARAKQLREQVAYLTKKIDELEMARAESKRELVELIAKGRCRE